MNNYVKGILVFLLMVILANVLAVVLTHTWMSPELVAFIAIAVVLIGVILLLDFFTKTRSEQEGRMKDKDENTKGDCGND